MNASATDIIARHLNEGNHAQAHELLDELLAREPQNARALHLRGKSLAMAGDHAQAIPVINAALKLQPDVKEAYFDLASSLEIVGQIATAAKVYELWLKLEQAQAAAEIKLSGSQKKKLADGFRAAEASEQKGNLGEAIDHYAQLLVAHPDIPDALLNLGNALYRAERYNEAQQMLIRAIQVKKQNGFALNSLGLLYRDTNKPARSIAAFRAAVAADPRYFTAALNLAYVFHELKLRREEITALEQVLTINADHFEIIGHLAHLYDEFGDWNKSAALKNKIKAMVTSGEKTTQPFIVATNFDSAALQKENATRYTAQKYPQAKAYDPSSPLPSGEGKLRIGYVSGDFHEHATAYLAAELFELHDRTQFEVHAFSYGPDDGSATRARLKQAVHQFHELRGMADDAAANIIRNHNIDILIDFKGYTEGQRLGILASRPAPLQMHYLVFPGTLGASFIDYFIADAVTVPAGREGDFTESIIRLPHSYQINDRKRPLPEKATRAQYGLPEQGLIFCDLNATYKITPEIFAIWMRLLAKTENSVLWLYETHSEASQRLREEASATGIDPARLYFAGNAPLAEHLKRYTVADLFIDTSPVCGHTTVSDALWAGLPVLTCAGESFITRVAASLLHAVGLPELVADNHAGYETKALELARDAAKLAGLRKHLEEGRMQFPLFDATRTTRALEAAYKHAARLHKEKSAPRAFTLAADLRVD